MKKPHEPVEKIAAQYSWDDLDLSQEKREQLIDIVSQLSPPKRLFRWFGYKRRKPTKKRSLLIFSGLTGTEITIAAQLLANELQLDLYTIDLSGVVSKYIGQTEKNLAKIFEEAEASNAILFFDEADALFDRRNAKKDAEYRYSKSYASYLLHKIEDYKGLVILSTGSRDVIDTLFKSRVRYFI